MTRATLGTSPRLNQPISETFYRDGARIYCDVSAGKWRARSYILLDQPVTSGSDKDLPRLWLTEVLKGAKPQRVDAITHGAVNIVDLFCGVGGLAIGVVSAAESVGLMPVVQAAADTSATALEVYDRHLRPRKLVKKNVSSLIDYQLRDDEGAIRFAYPPELLEPDLASLTGRTDLVIAGPPCEGHSNFNNYTRRSDPRNQLYLDVAATAIAVEAKAVVIENVASVLRDRTGVVGRARALLERSGYYVDADGVLEASEFGIPQTRVRHFLVASREVGVNVKQVVKALGRPTTSALEAISDLVDVQGSTEFDRPAVLSVENQRRVNWLFDNRQYDLPDDIRPNCHKDGNHKYKAVYGRMWPDRPSATLTTGFLSPGRGRYTHPLRPRGLTPHEGARLQTFPDNFQFISRSGMTLSRKHLAKFIGDAVPPSLGYVVGLAALSLIETTTSE